MIFPRRPFKINTPLSYKADAYIGIRSSGDTPSTGVEFAETICAGLRGVDASVVQGDLSPAAAFESLEATVEVVVSLEVVIVVEEVSSAWVELWPAAFSIMH